MKVKCIVIDDEPVARKGMQEYIAQVDFLELAGVFENAQKAYAVLAQQHVDLVFLDIEMPSMNGLDTAKPVTSETIKLNVKQAAIPFSL